MSTTLIRAAITAAALIVAAAPAAAVTTFTTTLSGANETVPTASTGTGTGTLTLATDMNSFTIAESFSGLTTNAVAGHVHCCAAAGANAAVAIGFTVPNATSGSFTQTYDLTSMSTYTSGFLTANGGTAASARTAFVTGLNSGLAYLNIHTTMFTGGEIRGQLPAIGAVPEPAMWAMMVVGFGMVGAVARRRVAGVKAA